MTINVMFSGLPGNVSSEIMKAVAEEKDFGIVRYGLKGTRYQDGSYSGVQLYQPERHEEGLGIALERHPDLLVADFTTPEAVNRNAELYASAGVPFVMGTTGGDRERLYDTVKGSRVSAVIAPNMSIPLVVLSAALEYIAKQFPKALDGYQGHITESHQAAKRDVSGTAKAWRSLLEQLGVSFDKIVSVREPALQRDSGVPAEHLEGHGYHWIDVSGNDVKLGIATAVNGRRTYAQGAVVALRYLHSKIQEGSRGEVFSMVDVLRGTSLL